MDNFLQEQFNKDIEQAIKESERIGYNPKIFKIMFYETYNKNGIELANILINKGQTYGFEELYKMGRLDLTIEARVLKPEFHSLFDEKILKKAKSKLAKLGYEDKSLLQEKIIINKPETLQAQLDTPYYEGNIVEKTILQKARNQEIVKAVKKRDDYTCRGCGFKFNNKIVEAHHLIPISSTEGEKQIKESDLITLCPNCHAIAHILLKQDEKYQKIENLIHKLHEIYDIN